MAASAAPDKTEPKSKPSRILWIKQNSAGEVISSAVGPLIYSDLWLHVESKYAEEKDETGSAPNINSNPTTPPAPDIHDRSLTLNDEENMPPAEEKCEDYTALHFHCLTNEIAEYRVERILARRFNKWLQTYIYKVKWQATEPLDDSWEPQSHLMKCLPLLEEFDTLYPRRSSVAKRLLRLPRHQVDFSVNWGTKLEQKEDDQNFEGASNEDHDHKQDVAANGVTSPPILPTESPIVADHTDSSSPIKKEVVNDDKKRFKCNFCTSSFTRNENLKHHRSIIHFKELGINPNDLVVKCPICSKSYPSILNMRYHLSTMHNKKGKRKKSTMRKKKNKRS